MLASVTHGKPLSSRGNRKVDVTGPFFENHVLGIMALLADTINDGKGPQPMLEKIRCLGAIREMIKVAKGHVGNGLPQVPIAFFAAMKKLMSHIDLCVFTLRNRICRPRQPRIPGLDHHDESARRRRDCSIS